RALLEQYPILKSNKNSNILILGAGGAAKGIYHAFIQNGYEQITIANRSIEKAQQIIQNDSLSKAISLQQAEESLSNFDVIVQTTSVGMKPHIEDMVIPLTALKEGAIVSDIVYQP